MKKLQMILSFMIKFMYYRNKERFLYFFGLSKKTKTIEIDSNLVIYIHWLCGCSWFIMWYLGLSLTAPQSIRLALFCNAIYMSILYISNTERSIRILISDLITRILSNLLGIISGIILTEIFIHWVI